MKNELTTPPNTTKLHTNQQTRGIRQMTKITVVGSNTTYEDLHFINTPLVVEAEWVECDGFWFVWGGEFSSLFPDRNFHSRYYFFPSEVEGNA